MDDATPDNVFTEDLLNDILLQAVKTWMETHGKTIADVNADAHINKSWLEPFIVALDVVSPVFQELSAPEKDTLNAVVGDFNVLCGLVPDGLRVVIQYQLKTDSGTEVAPNPVSSFLPLGKPVPYAEAVEFLKLLWEDWNEENGKKDTFELIATDAWETRSKAGSTAYEWLETLGPEAVVFNTPLKTEEDCRQFMIFAEGFMVGPLGVLKLANPFLTRDINGDIAGNFFALVVAELKQ